MINSNQSTILNKLEEIVFPILLDAAKNKLSLKDAAKRAKIPYSFLKKILEQINIAHTISERIKINETKNKIHILKDEIIRAMKARGIEY